MTNASASCEERHAHLSAKGLDGGILGQVLRAAILDIVVQSEDGLTSSGHAGTAPGTELVDHGIGVIMRHDMSGLEVHQVTLMDKMVGDGLALGAGEGMSLDNLLDQSLLLLDSTTTTPGCCRHELGEE